MIESADQRPWQLFVYGLCLLLVTACVSNDGVRAKRRDAGGVNDRAVIGGSDKTMVGPVIAQYMDDQARELQVLAETLRTGDGIIVTLPERLLFKLNSGALDPHSRHVLLKISAIITKYDKTHLTVVGHTDDRGFADFDIRLSERRAKAVADAFVKSGIPRSRIRIMGMGFARPIAGNDTAEGRSRNRRVEIHIAPDEQMRMKDQAPPA
jgi:outer membrane protein OmpA-like peptidoglycan-associated protein